MVSVLGSLAPTKLFQIESVQMWERVNAVNGLEVSIQIGISGPGWRWGHRKEVKPKQNESSQEKSWREYY